MSLTQRLQEAIAKGHDLPFVDFMQAALYDPYEGYYRAGLQKFGQAGDFITAPELSPLFGYSLATQFAPILAELKQACLLEFGAGTGRLCVDILTQLKKLNQLPDTYYILEISQELKHRQQAYISEQLPELASRVQWLEQLPQDPINAVVIANEVLDAMPVHRFKQTDEGILESFISLDTEGQFIEVFKPTSNQALKDYLATTLDKTLLPYQSEVNLWLEGWTKALSQSLNQAVIFLIDYGFPRHEYFHPDRSMGTLMCHWQHRAHPNPLIHVGQQDITTHVDFTHVAESAVDAGLDVLGFSNQASFLLSNGLLSFIDAINDEQEKFRAVHACKILLQPSEMGELFKVMALAKDFYMPLQGFQLQDRRASL